MKGPQILLAQGLLSTKSGLADKTKAISFIMNEILQTIKLNMIPYIYSKPRISRTQVD